jgi:hypothetical protein
MATSYTIRLARQAAMTFKNLSDAAERVSPEMDNAGRHIEMRLPCPGPLLADQLTE